MKRQMIQVATTTGTDLVYAWVFGDWAAHLRVGHSACWQVTFVPSGLNVFDALQDISPAEAKAIARALNRRAPASEVRPVFGTADGLDADWLGVVAATAAEVLGEGRAR